MLIPTIVVLYLYVGTFQCFVGPVFMVIVTEIFAVEIRSVAISVTCSALFAMTFVVQILYTATADDASNCTIAWSAIFAVSAVLTIASLHSEKVLPETMGIELSESENLWKEDAEASPDMVDDGNANVDTI